MNSLNLPVEWTLTHSWYALMGGPALEDGQVEDQYMPNNYSQVPLSLQGTVFIAREFPECLPDLVQEQIKDKGNSDGFAIAVTTFQMLWFCFNASTDLPRGKL